jgi:xanthine dehydrogenase accessory factor
MSLSCLGETNDSFKALNCYIISYKGKAMKDIYNALPQLFADGRFSVLATIIKQGGPSPRGIGAKCLIVEDGLSAGTIGGGRLEAQTLQEAKKVFHTRLPLRLKFLLKGTDVAGSDMLCGGEVEIFVEPVLPEHAIYASMFQEVIKIHNRGGAGLLVTAINQETWKAGEVPKIFLGSDGQRIGSLPGSEKLETALLENMDQILDARQPRILVLEDNGDKVEVFVEPVISDPVLYVFGGGHISKEIVPLADRVDFQVVVIDDRQEFADAMLFPDAREIYQLPFEGVMEKLPVDESSYLVIVTRGHMHDKTVLTQCLKTDARYIGMIGSRRKRNILYEKLIEEGFTQEDLSRVHAPVGIDIGAETPAEIAVSIVAELIKVRAGTR